MITDINKFLEDELPQFESTEREVFGLLLKDCLIGMNAVQTTNAYPVTENINKECEILKDIVCQ